MKSCSAQSSFQTRRIKVNEKRHADLMTLIICISNLIDDKSFVAETFKKYEFVVQDQAKLITREEVTAKFKQLTPEICKKLYWEELPVPKRRPFLPKAILNQTSGETTTENKIANKANLIEKYSFDEKCYKILEMLHEIVLKDYLNNHNPDILQILLQNNMSPITQAALFSKKETCVNKNEIKYILQVQRLIRSKMRQNFHASLFRKKPNEYNFIPTNIKNHSRIIKSAYDLISNHAIIDRFQYHFTTEQNLKSIIRSKYFYGYQTLQQENIFLEKIRLSLVTLRMAMAMSFVSVPT